MKMKRRAIWRISRQQMPDMILFSFILSIVPLSFLYTWLDV
jgi:hypothetical protein